MATYAFRDASGDLILNAPEFGKPTPAHAQTAGAEVARAAVRAAGKAKRIAFEDAQLITDHGRPKVVPMPGGPVTPTVQAFMALAEASGFEVRVVALTDRCVVEGVDREAGVGFRAYWNRGRTGGASWHERRFRYTLVRDARPVGINKITRTGLKGKRAAGVGETRLSIVASPLGQPLTITELETKVREHGD